MGGSTSTSGIFSSTTGMTDDEAIEEAKDEGSSMGWTYKSESDSWEFIDSNTSFSSITRIYQYEIVYDEGTIVIRRDTTDAAAVETSVSYNSYYLTIHIDSTGEETTYSIDSSNTNSESGETEEGSDSSVVAKYSKGYVSSDSSKVLYFINYARMYLNVTKDDQYIPMSFGYLLIYIVLIVFTVMFTVRYMKRVIYIAFLTLIAPLVALTYPIDKIKDRKGTSI